MRSRASSSSSSSASFALKVLPSSLDTHKVWEGGDIASPLIEKKSPSAEFNWSADATDIFVLLCSFFLSAISIAFIAVVFHTQSTPDIPYQTLSIFQRVISSLSVTITSAVIVVAGKRYLFFKLARGGLRSRRVAVYSNPSIGALVSHLVLHGTELPLLGLSAVWVLALVTSLTVDNSWGLESVSELFNISVPSGPLNAATPGSSWVIPASEQLAFVMSSACLGLEREVGLINITGTNIPSNHPLEGMPYPHPSGVVYYPPLQLSPRNVGYSFSTMMNGFNFSMEYLSSVPSTAHNLTCRNSTFNPSDLWLDGSDNETLSIIFTSPSASSSVPQIARLNATAFIMGGTLLSFGNYSEFALNGTSWPSIMSKDSLWAEDIVNLICNTTLSPIGFCRGSTLLDFALTLNGDFWNMDMDRLPTHWGTALSMALGAYSSVIPLEFGYSNLIPVTSYAAVYAPRYGVYILILHILVSLIVLVIVVRLRLASRIGADFINSTRLLLDPLKKPDLFNASLETTLDVLGDPYMVVREDSDFLVTGWKTTGETRERKGRLALRNLFDRTLR